MGQPLYMQIYDFLKAAILKGDYNAGDMIPSEEELMKQFDVSRITTNRALQMLTTEGYLKRRPGVGTFVLDTTPVHADTPTERPLFQDDVSVHPPHAVERAASAEATAPDETAIPDRRHAVGGAVTQPLVGFIIPFLSGSFGRTTLVHVEKILNKRGIPIVLATSGGDQKQEEACINRLVAAHVQGMIVLPVNGEFYNDAILRLYVDRFPVVLVDKELPGIPIPSVTSNNEAAAYTLTEHLISGGHRHIAFCAPKLHETTSLIHRYDGFLSALRHHGIQPDADHMIAASVTGPAADGLDTQQVAEIAQFLQAHPDITAVLATDDQLADHVRAAAERIGLRIPYDLAIACFDSPAVKGVGRNYTHALQDEAEMAKACVRILDALWAEDNQALPQSVVVPCKIYHGPSTIPDP